MIYPVEHKKVTSPYGMRTLQGRESKFHYGTDFTGKNKYALAPCDMDIVKVVLPDGKYPYRFKYNRKSGRYELREDVPPGRAWSPYIRAECLADRNISFIFKHVRAIVGGGIVKEGERIAEVGNWGFSMGPHLHFEVLINGENVDPIEFLETGV